MLQTQSLTCRDMQFSADLAGPPDGQLVLFLHGFPQTRYTWRTELPAVAALGYRCCAFDQRGYSQGARPDDIASYVIEELIADVLGIADTLGYETLHLVGHDWGGQLAWCTAALHPSRIRSLAVISRPHPGAFLNALANDPQQAGRSSHHRRFQATNAADELLADDAQTLRKMYVDWGGVPAGDAEAYLATLGNRQALNAAINWYRAVGQTSIDLAHLPGIEAPTMYVWGTADTTVGEMAALATGAQVSGPFTFHELPEVGHFVTDQVPGVFTNLLAQHLQSLR